MVEPSKQTSCKQVSEQIILIKRLFPNSEEWTFTGSSNAFLHFYTREGQYRISSNYEETKVVATLHWTTCTTRTTNNITITTIPRHIQSLPGASLEQGEPWLVELVLTGNHPEEVWEAAAREHGMGVRICHLG